MGERGFTGSTMANLFQARLTQDRELYPQNWSRSQLPYRLLVSHSLPSQHPRQNQTPSSYYPCPGLRWSYCLPFARWNAAESTKEFARFLNAATILRSPGARGPRRTVLSGNALTSRTASADLAVPMMKVSWAEEVRDSWRWKGDRRRGLTVSVVWQGVVGS